MRQVDSRTRTDTTVVTVEADTGMATMAGTTATGGMIVATGLITTIAVMEGMDIATSIDVTAPGTMLSIGMVQATDTVVVIRARFERCGFRTGNPPAVAFG